MDHVWSVLCQMAIPNQETRNVSLIETLERIAFQASDSVVPEGGVLPISFAIVSMWWRSDLKQPEHSKGRVLVKAPDGQVLKQVQEYEFDLDLDSHDKMRVTIRFGGIPLKGSGIYRFIIQYRETKRWKEVASIPLEIVQMPADTPG